MAHLTRGLKKYGLTKAEKLQIVNMCPQTVLELYVVRFMSGVTSKAGSNHPPQIVEEVETRFEHHLDEILALVKEKLTEQPQSLTDLSSVTNGDVIGEPVPEVEEDADMWGEEGAAQYLEEEFEEGGDDFEPTLELDELREPQD